MSNWAEFEEKEFETLANLSLILSQPGGNVRAYSPGQVLENELGFDFATRVEPGGPLDRLLFGGIPSQFGINPGQVNHIPITPATSLLNVFLQYKRPERFPANRHRSPVQPEDLEFLAFTVRDFNAQAQNRFVQLESMIELENTLNTYALVNYACPSVWRTQALYYHFSNNTLLDKTCFVSPSNLSDAWGDQRHHVRWTFDPNHPDIGIPNPDGQDTSAKPGTDFLQEIALLSKQPALKAAGLAESLTFAGHASEQVRTNAKSKGLKETIEIKQAESAAFLEATQEFSGQERELVEATIHTALMAKGARLKWLMFVD